MPIYMGIFEKPNVLDKKFRGDVKAKGYEGWIQLQSAQLGGSRSVTSAPPATVSSERRAQAIEDIVITKLLDWCRRLSPGKLSTRRGSSS